MAFDEWVHKKDEFDKGLDLLRKIDPGRWEKRDSHAKVRLRIPPSAVRGRLHAFS